LPPLAKRRLVRAPDLLICWKRGQLFIEQLQEGQSIRSSPAVIELLNLFTRPREAGEAARRCPGYERSSVLNAITDLARLRLLISEGEAERRTSRLTAWRRNLASVYYHVAARDIPFLRGRQVDRWEKRLASKRRPARFKRYHSPIRISVPKPRSVYLETGTLLKVLKQRRTVREFRREAIKIEELTLLIRGTWGQTGWLDAESLGRFIVKSSPSAGALHPIECYVLAWSVRGLSPGLYHYDVSSSELRRLRSGDFRTAAIEAASGQRWVANGAFLCVMTAVFERTLWKYELENAYRVVWLDAGHLAQTFCLLATSLGLGPFTTAAIQDSYIEKLIGLDGIKEFPVYLCGAGVPAKKLL